MGGFIYTLLILLEALLSALLIAVIFMQRTKGGMGGTAFGGGAGEAIFGSRMGNVLTKATVIMGCIFLVNTILLTIMTARRGESRGSVMDRAEPAPMQAPSTPEPLTLPESGPMELPETPKMMPDTTAGEIPPVADIPPPDAPPSTAVPAPGPEAPAPVEPDPAP